MKKVCLSLSMVLISLTLKAQDAQILKAGTIEFEKKINMYGAMKQMYQFLHQQEAEKKLDSYKDVNSQFVTLKAKLNFDTDKSYYLPDPVSSDQAKTGNLTPLANQFNEVYLDFANETCTIQKNFFGTFFLIKSDFEHIKWKLTDEKREIAGYLCQRANGITKDSVEVVAFFTNRIPVQAGPEKFYGLPGMILGIAIPNENVTWFATKIISNRDFFLEQPKKGKIVNSNEMRETIKKFTTGLGTKGEYINRILSIM